VRACGLAGELAARLYAYAEDQRFWLHDQPCPSWLRLNPRPEKEKLERPTLPILVEKCGIDPLEAITAIKAAKERRSKPRPYGHWNDVRSRLGAKWTDEERKELCPPQSFKLNSTMSWGPGA
jgi:hypothetical protein